MLFQTEKASLKPSRIIASAYDAMFLSGAVLGFGSALLFAGSLDRISKAALTTFGMAGMACYTANCKASEKVRKVGDALDKVQWESMKYQLKEEEQVYQLAAEVDGASRKVELIINKSNPWEWAHWAKRAGVEPNMPPLQDLTGDVVEQPITSHPQRIVETEFVEFKEEIPDLPRKVADDMRNTLIVGVPGSGKGLFVSNCLGYVQDRSDTTVFYLDPKNDEKETGYFWGRVDRLYRLPEGNVVAEPANVHKWLENCLKEYDAFKVTPDKPRKLLVVDELTGIMEALEELGSKELKWFKRKINTYVASGDSRGITLWGIAQNGHNTGVGMDGGEKSQLTPIALIYAKQVTASQGLQKADFIPGDQKLNSSDIQAICNKSQIGRAIFHGGLNQWFPMPVLPNPSGYDRDNRKSIAAESSKASIDTVIVDSLGENKNDNADSEGARVDVFGELKAWVQSLDNTPTDEELSDKWEKITGKAINYQGLRMLKERLGFGK